MQEKAKRKKASKQQNVNSYGFILIFNKKFLVTKVRLMSLESE